MRRLAVRVHLWGGLITGPLLLVLGLSGAVLVFRPELDNGFAAPSPMVNQPGGSPSFDAVAAAARFFYPGAEVRALRLPARADRPWHVRLAAGARRLDVEVDPYALRVVGGRAPERSTLAAVHSLHAAFHAGRAGALLVGALGLWLVVEAASGLWLYGPWSAGRARRSGSRGLHRLVGGLSLVVGAILGLTGALLAAAAALSVAAQVPRPGALTRLDAVAARAQSALPGGYVTALVAAGNPTVRVEMRLPSGDTRVVTIDGEVLTVTRPRTHGWDLIRRAHAGDFAGRLSQIVYVAVGLALPVLSVTGFIISTRRRARGRAGRPC
jgi:uncharacterized iron-regulated membrane protein